MPPWPASSPPPRLHCGCVPDQLSSLHLTPDAYLERAIQHVRRLSVVSSNRLRATGYLARAALLACIPGDFVETGVYKGGSTALLMRVLLDYDPCERKLWAFDSFEGLPDTSPEDKSGDGHIGEKGQFRMGHATGVYI